MAILCPKNENAFKVNHRILLLLEGENRCYYSADCHTEEERAQYPIEVLNSLTPMGMPPHYHSSLEKDAGCNVGTQSQSEAWHVQRNKTYRGNHGSQPHWMQHLQRCLQRRKFSSPTNFSRRQEVWPSSPAPEETVSTSSFLLHDHHQVTRADIRQGLIYQDNPNTYTYNCVYRKVFFCKNNNLSRLLGNIETCGLLLFCVA